MKSYTVNSQITAHTGWAVVGSRKLDPTDPLMLQATRLDENRPCSHIRLVRAATRGPDRPSAEAHGRIAKRPILAGRYTEKSRRSSVRMRRICSRSAARTSAASARSIGKLW